MNFANLFDTIYEKLYCSRRRKEKKRSIKRKEWVERYSKYPLSKEDKAEIENFFVENLGRKEDLRWHLLYASYTGVMDKKYISAGLYMTEIEPKFNPLRYRRTLADKNLLPLYTYGIENLRAPKTYGACIGGVYRDAFENVVTKEELIDSLSNIGKSIIKPTVDSDSGRNVNLLCIENGVDIESGKNLSEIVSNAGKNFVIQERIINHKSISDLHKNSVNTFRVITYIWGGKVWNAPVTMRLGRGKSFLDNAHAGGMYVGVSDDGYLYKCGFSESAEELVEHPDSHIKFDGYRIEHIPQILECAKKMHSKIPQLGIISWDMTVDEQGNVIVIEANTKGQSMALPQMANGRSLFGDNTEEILRYLNKKARK